MLKFADTNFFHDPYDEVEQARAGYIEAIVI